MYNEKQVVYTVTTVLSSVQEDGQPQLRETDCNVVELVAG